MNKEIRMAGQWTETLHADPHSTCHTKLILSINLGIAENTLPHDLIREFANTKVSRSLWW